MGTEFGGSHWLLTRPDGQNESLAERMRALGLSVSVAPALTIQSCQLSEQQFLWQQLHGFSALLFTSINAVDGFAQQLTALGLVWPSAHYLAIGRVTAERLAEHGQQAVYPASGFTSEALLDLPLLAELRQQRLLLVTGMGGRGVLQPALQQRQLQVARLDVYRRECNRDFCWPTQKVEGLLVTSLESWHCLRSKAETQLRACQVIAGSERIAAQVRLLAHATFAAASPADDDMLAQLKEMF